MRQPRSGSGYEQAASAVVEALELAGGAGFGTNDTVTASLCFLEVQPVEVTRAALPLLSFSVVCRPLSAEYVPGAGCCRKSGIEIVSFLPLILPWSTAFTAPGDCSR